MKNARPHLGEEPFLFYLGDNIVLGSLRPLVERFEKGGLDCLLALSKVSDPQRFEFQKFETVKLFGLSKNRPILQATSPLPAFTSIRQRFSKLLHPSHRRLARSMRFPTPTRGLSNTALASDTRRLLDGGKDTGKPDDLLEGNALILNGLPPNAFATKEKNAQTRFFKEMFA